MVLREMEFTLNLPSGATGVKKIAGTIQEVLTQLANLAVTRKKVVKNSWYDDGINMEVIIINNI